MPSKFLVSLTDFSEAKVFLRIHLRFNTVDKVVKELKKQRTFVGWIY